MFRQIFENELVSGQACDAFVALEERQAGSATKTLLKIIYIRKTSFGLLWQALQLNFEDGGLKFRHAIVEADEPVAKLICYAGAPAIHIRLCAFEMLKAAGNDGAPFARRDDFAGLKTEATEIPGSACALAAPLASVSVRAIFNDGDVSGASDAQDFVEVREIHREMHGKNGARFRRDSPFDEVGVETVCVGIHVNENRDGVEKQNRTYRAFPGVRGDDHFVAGLYAGRF